MKAMKTAFAIAAHPDDIEFFMSGTLMLLRDAGYEIHYLNIANGCCGTTEYDAETIARMRREEALAAARFAGAIFHDSLCDDLAIFYDRETLAKVAAVVREVSPEILLTHSPDDYMEDHMNACRLAVTAAFARGMPNFPTDPPRSPVDGSVTVYHAQPYSHRDPLRRMVRPTSTSMFRMWWNARSPCSRGMQHRRNGSTRVRGMTPIWKHFASWIGSAVKCPGGIRTQKDGGDIFTSGFAGRMTIPWWSHWPIT